MSKLVKGIGSALGFGGDSAVQGAANEQAHGINQQIDYMRGAETRANERLAPYNNLGLSGISAFKDFLNPASQQEYLSSNPMFQAAIDSTSTQMKGVGAAAGKFNSGGMVNSLFNNYMSQGQDFVNNRFNQLLAPVQMGQSSAAGTAANIMNTGTNVGSAFANKGDVMGSSILAQQNAQAGLGNNLLQMGGSALAFFSDRNFKKNIEKVDEDEYGNIYEFDYIWGGRYRGRMADELRKIRPDSVMELDGALLVSDEFEPIKVA
jgi:hypothetical protein